MRMFGDDRLKDVQKVGVLAEGVRRWWKLRRGAYGKLWCWWRGRQEGEQMSREGAIVWEDKLQQSLVSELLLCNND